MHRYKGTPLAALPEKKTGRHRFIVIASYVVSHDTVNSLYDDSEQVILDQENLWDLSVGCIDCEQPYSKELKNYCDAPEYKDPGYGNRNEE